MSRRGPNRIGEGVYNLREMVDHLIDLQLDWFPKSLLLGSTIFHWELRWGKNPAVVLDRFVESCTQAWALHDSFVPQSEKPNNFRYHFDDRVTGKSVFGGVCLYWCPFWISPYNFTLEVTINMSTSPKQMGISSHFPRYLEALHSYPTV